jgi:ketosteroid isomerase-like protein
MGGVTSQTEWTTAMTLPEPIAAYFTAANGDDSDSVASCFTEDAVVRDEKREMRGRRAIRDWAEETRRKYRYHAAATAMEQTGYRTVITAHLSGDFPGSPIDLPYRFTLSGAHIAALEIG